jgi:hypothetical protein
VPVTEESPNDTRPFGWFASRLDGPGTGYEPPFKAPRDGSVIRLMGEETVDIPLWDEHGLLFDEPEEVVRELGVSQDLAADLKAWGVAWQTRVDQATHDAEAARLVRRLGEEVGHRYEFLYHP